MPVPRELSIHAASYYLKRMMSRGIYSVFCSACEYETRMETARRSSSVKNNTKTDTVPNTSSNSTSENSPSLFLLTSRLRQNKSTARNGDTMLNPTSVFSTQFVSISMVSTKPDILLCPADRAEPTPRYAIIETTTTTPSDLFDLLIRSQVDRRPDSSKGIFLLHDYTG